MYEDFFGLKARPFPSLPRTDLYFPATAIENARQTLLRCVGRGEGPAVIVGPSGSGKTLLCQLLAEHFRSTFRVALVSRGWMNTRRAFLQAILYELRQPYRGLDEGELRLALVDYVTSNDDCPKGILLMVDEAHQMPLRLLDEARMLTNLASSGQPRVRLVLCGGAALEERFATPRLESFTQRIIARCYLETLNRTETRSYIHAQLGAAGGRPESIFPVDACDSVHRATDGVPRLINQLCDHAMLLAFTATRRQVNAACVDEAWADLQQLPTPWNSEPQIAKPEENIIEFGGLDDEPNAPTESVRDTVPMLRVTGAREEPDPESLESLDEIEAAVHELGEEFRPGSTSEPEAEIILSSKTPGPAATPANPFGDGFAEEELILDRYAELAPSGAAAEVPAPAIAAVEPTRPTPSSVQPPVDAKLISAEPVEPIVALPPAAETPALPARDDSDLIVVEPSYETEATKPSPAPSADLRRLFARLRSQ